ncbi:uncharacterized protein LOC126833952 isoform X2 [Adelges cooleyi]|uniref:uncharacterized protein LOC126833952 isoform X2 n=1 Tax=Adelges cooleyi TaxID=133065 RepID=UPI00217F9933|nr:uncharacterized protein LOC126833952 isoform X2 [Adelges cooleyi]
MMRSIIFPVLFYIFIVSCRRVDGGNNCLRASNEKLAEELKMGDIVEVQSPKISKENPENPKFTDILEVGVLSSHNSKETPEEIKLDDTREVGVQPANNLNEELKKGDIVGVQSANRSGLEYGVVKRDGRSPFGSQKILEHRKYRDFDYETYRTNIFECIGNLSPDEVVTSEHFEVGDIIGYMYEDKPGVSYRLLKDKKVRETLVTLLQAYSLDMFAIFKNTDDKYYEILDKYIGWN